MGVVLNCWVCNTLLPSYRKLIHLSKILLSMSDSPRPPKTQDKDFYLLLKVEMITRDSDLRMNLIN